MTLTAHDLINAAKRAIREIGASELMAARDRGAAIVDVRELGEFEDGHIPGAVSVLRGLLEFEVDGHPAVNNRTEEALSHRERPVVLYCLSGGRSTLAADALKRMGFSQPMSLSGGILSWGDQGASVLSKGLPDPSGFA